MAAMRGSDSRMIALIATCNHRLEQFTRPTFDRAVVEDLIDEIHRLNRADAVVIAQALAERDNTIDELQEQIDDLQEDHDEELLAAGRQIHELEALNTKLAEANRRLAAQLGMPLRKPVFMAPTESEAVAKGADRLTRNGAPENQLSPEWLKGRQQLVERLHPRQERLLTDAGIDPAKALTLSGLKLVPQD